MKNLQTQNVIYQHQYFYLYVRFLAQQLNLLVFFRNLSLIDDALSVDDITPINDSFITEIDLIPITDFSPENDIIPVNPSNPINDMIKNKTRKNIIKKDKWHIGDSEIPQKINLKDNSQEEIIPKGKPTSLPEKETDKTNNKYKSPLKKLVVYFKKSRDNWKKKCLDSKYKLKITKHKAKRLEIDRNRYKNEVKQLKNKLYDISNRELILRNELDNLKKMLKT
jgi:hypothetical protein